jgi:hypothetical protein
MRFPPPPLQVSTSSSRLVKILGDALCVRELLRDTCGCDVSLSQQPPAAASTADSWGCSDSASIAGLPCPGLCKALLYATAHFCLQGSGARSRPPGRHLPADGTSVSALAVMRRQVACRFQLVACGSLTPPSSVFM